MKEKHFRLFFANFVIVFALLAAFGIAFATTLSSSDVAAPVGNAIYGGDASKDGVALMFNVYESPQNALKIADILDSYAVSATFFVGGCWVAKNPNALLQIAARGFEIGNHGYLHRDHATLTLKQNIDEIQVAARLIDATLGGLPGYANSKLFAPPSGSMGNNMFAACDKLGYRVIMWTRDTIDWRDHDPELIYSRAVRDLAAGDLILMHPTDATVIALPKILDAIKQAGLSAMSVGELV